jgi:WXG100 family type VII secretion target
MASIRLEYEQLTLAAEDATRLASETRDTLQALAQTNTALIPTWDGVARSAYDRTLSVLNREFDHLPRMLDQIHTALLRTRALIESAETEAGRQIDTTVVNDTAGGAR